MLVRKLFGLIMYVTVCFADGHVRWSQSVELVAEFSQDYKHTDVMLLA